MVLDVGIFNVNIIVAQQAAAVYIYAVTCVSSEVGPSIEVIKFGLEDIHLCIGCRSSI